MEDEKIRETRSKWITAFNQKSVYKEMNRKKLTLNERLSLPNFMSSLRTFKLMPPRSWAGDRLPVWAETPSSCVKCRLSSVSIAESLSEKSSSVCLWSSEKRLMPWLAKVFRLPSMLNESYWITQLIWVNETIEQSDINNIFKHTVNNNKHNSNRQQ